MYPLGRWCYKRKDSLICQGQTRRKAGTQSFRSKGRKSDDSGAAKKAGASCTSGSLECDRRTHLVRSFSHESEHVSPWCIRAARKPIADRALAELDWGRYARLWKADGS